MFTRFRLKIRDFFRRNKNKIIIALIIWVIVIAINYFFANMKTPLIPKVSYNPHQPTRRTDPIPEKLKKPIENLLDEFFNVCNNKEYERAYEMLSEDCVDSLYPDIEEFKKYVDQVYDTKKIYHIQNYTNSKKDGTYIYSVRILDDIMATGMTGQNSELYYYEEKYVIKEEGDELKLSIRQYIGDENVNSVYEDKYMKVSILEKKVKYETERYTVKVTNRTNYIIVLSDFTQRHEICLNLDNQDIRDNATSNSGRIIINPKETKNFEFEFNKYYDEPKKSVSIIFNVVRILRDYTGSPETKQQELDEAIEVYSFEVQV